MTCLNSTVPLGRRGLNSYLKITKIEPLKFLALRFNFSNLKFLALRLSLSNLKFPISNLKLFRLRFHAFADFAQHQHGQRIGFEQPLGDTLQIQRRDGFDFAFIIERIGFR